MTSFPAFTLSFVQKYSCLYNKENYYIIKRITRRLEDMDFICSFVKYCFYHSKIKFISSPRRAISSILLQVMNCNPGQNYLREIENMPVFCYCL